MKKGNRILRYLFLKTKTDCVRRYSGSLWAGVSFKTICDFDIHEASPRYSAITGDDGGFIGFKNIEQFSDHSVEENMEVFRKLKENYPGKFILASIMGRDDDEWERLARAISPGSSRIAAHKK